MMKCEVQACEKMDAAITDLFEVLILLKDRFTPEEWETVVGYMRRVDCCWDRTLEAQALRILRSKL